MGIGTISPFGLYRHTNDPDNERDKFYTFPVLNDIGMNETHLVYRSDYNLPKYVHDFIHDTEAVFKNYAEFIARDLIIRNKRRQEK